MSPCNGLVSLSMVASNVARLSEVGDFHHLGSAEIDAENQTLINHKCVCGDETPPIANVLLAAAGYFSFMSLKVYIVILYSSMS
jgi:hypothetical protein